MRILIIGSGGREHALAWKLSRSPRSNQLFIAPGNGGTANVGQNVPLAADDIPALVNWAAQEKIDLAVVGPEAPLVAGVVDALKAIGLRAFGPDATAAQLEGSKAFAKQFMIEEGIPTAPAAIFTGYAAARTYLHQAGVPCVIKASGLAAGKGVMICNTVAEAEDALYQMMVRQVFGPAGDQVLIETCLQGEEVSLLAFCDGRTVRSMLPARDYKRVADDDQGPNTGGMGGYAPSPHVPPALAQEIVSRVLQPTVDGMRRRGAPYVGVLYAGLMLTLQGPRVLEFNCRFGDPETQVLLPLLETDLVEIMLACIEGRLDEIDIDWKPGYSACVVLASEGYPADYKTGQAISGLNEAKWLADAIFHAGAKQQAGQLVTSGGRVLGITATGVSLQQARERAYAAVERVKFDGMHYRRDIGTQPPPTGQQAHPSSLILHPSPTTYAAAGVDIAAGNQAVALMKEAVRNTYTPAVLAGIGAFGGLFAMQELAKPDTILVASTDGVGTKTLIAAALGRYNTVGRDIVNHSVNDILVQGARPLFFLDYVAAARLDPQHIAAIVQGCAEACQEVGCVLLGGETAEMPGVYRPGTFDLAGTMIGWVERSAIVDGKQVQPGDVCLGLPSSGLHTNGYSLARRVFADTPWDTILPELDQPLGELLLTPHRAYLKQVEAMWAADIKIKAMAHITGGGFVENIPRSLPGGIGVQLDRAAWQAPLIFQLIQQRGQIDELEMYRVFNMGIGMVLLIAPEAVDRAIVAVPEAIVIGQAVTWDGNAPRVKI